jgi:hypothetical protein
MQFNKKSVLGVVAAGVAAVALTPAAAHGAGSLVTLVDSATNVPAKVSAAGQLATSNSDAIETTPFAAFGRAGNNATDRVILAGPTNKTIALSSLTAAATGGAVGVRVRAVEPTDGSCAAGHSVIVRGELMSFVVPSGNSHSVSFPSPIIARPAAGKLICIIAHADTTYVPASGAVMTVSGSGFAR